MEFEYHKARRGYRNSFGAPEEPDEPESLEITEIYHAGEEILCIMDDASISKVEKLVLAQRGGK